MVMVVMVMMGHDHGGRTRKSEGKLVGELPELRLKLCWIGEGAERARYADALTRSVGLLPRTTDAQRHALKPLYVMTSEHALQMRHLNMDNSHEK